MNETLSQYYDVVVVGGGVTGLAASCILACKGLSVACLHGPASLPVHPDFTPHISRSTAIMAPTWTALATHLESDTLPAAHTPLCGLMMIDGKTASLFRASDIAGEDTPHFGWSIPNDDLVAYFYDLCAARVDFHSAFVSRITFSEGDCTLHAEGEHGAQAFRTPFVIGADGAQSVCRKALGLKVYTLDRLLGGQWILTAHVTHSKDHEGISYEHLRSGGVLTGVPAAGTASNIIWIDEKGDIDYLRDLDDAAFLEELQTHFGNHLGSISAVTDRHIFPLRTQTASDYCARRIFLVGESAHVLPPIGAQGLNLGLRDAVDAATVIAQAIDQVLSVRSDSGALSVSEEALLPLMRDYRRRRRFDHLPRHMAVSGLNFSLLSDSALMASLRRNALTVFERFPALKRAVMRMGMHSMSM